MQEILADHVTWALTHLMQYVQSSFIADLYPLLETLSFGWNDCDAMDWHDAYSRVKAVLPSYGDEKASKVLKQLWSRHMGASLCTRNSPMPSGWTLMHAMVTVMLPTLHSGASFVLASLRSTSLAVIW